MSELPENDLYSLHDAHAAISDVAVAFDRAHRRYGSVRPPLSWSGCRVFSMLAKRKGIFAAPVLLERDQLDLVCGYSHHTIGLALRRLGACGFLTLSGPRVARMVQLHLPDEAIALYEKRAAERRADPDYYSPAYTVEQALTLLEPDGFPDW